MHARIPEGVTMTAATCPAKRAPHGNQEWAASNVNLQDGWVRVLGKGSKERRVLFGERLGSHRGDIIGQRDRCGSKVRAVLRAPPGPFIAHTRPEAKSAKT